MIDPKPSEGEVAASVEQIEMVLNGCRLCDRQSLADAKAMLPDSLRPPLDVAYVLNACRKGMSGAPQLAVTMAERLRLSRDVQP